MAPFLNHMVRIATLVGQEPVSDLSDAGFHEWTTKPIIEGAPFLNVTGGHANPFHNQTLLAQALSNFGYDPSRCVNPSAGNPPASMWDHPGWKWTDNDACSARFELDEDGLCFHALEQTPHDFCSSWCVTSHGWFYGIPVELSGTACGSGDNCGRSISLTINHNINAGGSWTEGTSRSITETRSQSTSGEAEWKFGWAMDLTIPTGTAADLAMIPQVGWGTSKESKGAPAAGTGGAGVPAAGADETNFKGPGHKIGSPPAGLLPNTKWEHPTHKRRGEPAKRAAKKSSPLKLGQLGFDIAEKNSEALSFLFADSIGKNNAVSGSLGRSQGISVSKTETHTRDGDEVSHCGSWYAVPKIHYRCGLAAWSYLKKENGMATCIGRSDWHKPVCEFWAQRLTVNHPDPEIQQKMDKEQGKVPGASYRENFDGGRDFEQDSDVKHDLVFVKQDCQTKEILPGPFQEEAFANSLNFHDYYIEHFMRYDDWFRKSSDLADRAKNKRDQDKLWDLPRHGERQKTTIKERTVGPKDYTIKACMKAGLNDSSYGNWCHTHKLNDGQCFTFPAGDTVAPYVKIGSVDVSPGNCCVLFSKHECVGTPQRVMGRIDDLHKFNFHRKAHSVICNVKEYCDPDARESSISQLRPAFSQDEL